MNTHQVRRLPKKTVIIISILIALGFIIFYIIKDLKEEKLKEVLATIGHPNISQLKVINKLNVEDIQTKMKSSVYKVVFYDNDLKQTCMGFLHHERDNTYTKDLDCK